MPWCSMLNDHLVLRLPDFPILHRHQLPGGPVHHLPIPLRVMKVVHIQLFLIIGVKQIYHQLIRTGQ
ncbi:hypothetical protein D3C85_1848720 [compost metagenome]